MWRALGVGIWHRMAVAAVGLALMSVAVSAYGQPGQFCCRCACGGDLACVTVATPSDCPGACPGVNCTVQVLNSSCASAPLECPTALGAPAIGSSGATVVALILAALGVVGLRRAAARRRA